eukprot:snap_masked-scaffold510_size151595-processed-gene-0.0 protein:Tk04748 transcript:snap_masked-scaffold510_size151595-processed-gene-0.0-mRNA-1 annotation:"exosome complex exonuclease rrp44"
MGVLVPPMWAQKTFLKRTRRGRVIKVAREHYLRRDIACGLAACPDCQAQADPLGRSRLAPLTASPCPSLVPQPHLLLLDTNVILDQIDLLEAPGLANVVIPQTVAQEVRHRSGPVFRRLQELFVQPRKHFYLFLNEHHVETWSARKPGESPNDYHDRAIRLTAAWYAQHAACPVVLLTEDGDNRRRAQAQGLTALPVADYVRALTAWPSLIERLAARVSISAGSAGSLFPEHLAPDAINRGLKRGTLQRGVFHLNRTNYLEAGVSVAGHDRPVLIRGPVDQNRAVDGDHVAVRVWPAEQWRAPAEIVLADDGPDPGDTLAREIQLLAAPVPSGLVQPTGQVVGIIRRQWRPYCGLLQAHSQPQATRHIFVAAEGKIPKIRVETRQAAGLAGHRIIVAIDAWPRHSRYPLGHFVRSLGPLGDKATENEVLLLEHDVPHAQFSEAVLDELPKLPWSISERDQAGRVDYRHLDICSVDPPGCTDIDDALHCRELPLGRFQVGVHIADVSHFLRPGTSLDREAAHRSTTVYLTDRRIDMVPERLSSNLCSLRGGVDRLAFSCVWEMDAEANIISTQFHKSIIRSRSAMTYEQAQNRIDDPDDQEPVAHSLRHLMKLAQIMKKRRMDLGALVLASSEIRFNVDSETADPIDVQVKTIRDTNFMVEEFMLAANTSAAQRIFREFPECAMLRRHPAPPPSNFDPLVKAGQQQGYVIKVDSGKALADSLNAASDGANTYFNTMLRMIATRCMMQAVYFASGTIEQPLFQHYGLACPIYTHFTSPIRRYADVIVHRLLAAAIGADATYPDLLDKKVTQRIANNINYRHRMAQYASRASVNLHTHLYFRSKKRDEVGYILFVRQNAVQVLIPKYGLEGTLFLRGSESEGRGLEVDFQFNEEIPSQTCGAVTLRLFQKLKVQLSLDSTNVQHEQLVLRLVEPVIPGFSVSPTNDGLESQMQPIPDSKTTKRQSPATPAAETNSGKKKKKSRD